MPSRSTLIKPPPTLPNHSPIESALSLLRLSDIGPDIFTNARPLWHPPGARGIFGGAAIAQCLAAAQATIPPEFTVHSMHCYFVLAGNSEIPVLYYVERVRDGKSFITRTVQARQQGRCIFTTTISFMREASGGKRAVEHQVEFPAGVTPPPDGYNRTEEGNAKISPDSTPFEQVRTPVAKGGKPQEKKLRQWMRARGRISGSPPGVGEEGSEAGEKANLPGENHQAHLSALAYMTDSYFIGTVARVHNLVRFSSRRNVDIAIRGFQGGAEEKRAMRAYLEEVAKQEADENEGQLDPNDDRQIGMMVSLDHTIFFHNPRAFRADEWMLQEMETPWAGDGRGVVLQRIWSKDGTLIATCTQEGVVRLVQKDSKL